MRRRTPCGEIVTFLLEWIPNDNYVLNICGKKKLITFTSFSVRIGTYVNDAALFEY